MVRIRPNDFNTIFVIDLLPTLVGSDDITYTVQSGETYYYTNEILGIISKCTSNDDVKLTLIDQLHHLELHGGVFASLSKIYDLADLTGKEAEYIMISLNKEINESSNYIHEKKIKFLLSGIPIELKKTHKELVEAHFTELIHQIFANFINRIKRLNNNKNFVNQLFTDTTVTVGETESGDSFGEFDPSLYDYLLTLNSRL